jgi:IclR family transcriptional regulator, acetate operon repressor
MARPVSETPSPAFQVLERTFGILEVFGEARPEWTTTDIARELGVPIPTVHRILGALRRLGYVSQDQVSKRFRLGTAALLLGTRARGVTDLRSVALEPLRHLARELEETALLTGLSPNREASVCLERVESRQPLRLSLEPGRQVPLHAGASQKALLAFMPEAEAERLAERPLARLCRATITDNRKLAEEMRVTRRRGYACSFEETNVGVWGVAVPVVSESDVVCAVGVAGPSPRLTADVLQRAIRLSHAAAADIGRALGHSVPRLDPGAMTLGAVKLGSVKPRRRP